MIGLAEERLQQSAPEGDEAPEDQQPETSGASTPEDIEAYWRKRFSNHDKAHAEETRVLRERAEAAERSQRQALTGQQQSSDESGRYQSVIEDLQQRLDAERSGRVYDVRRATYPEASEAIGDPAVLTTMDEGRLAALNERLRLEASPAPRRVDANNPARPANAPPKPMSEMSKDELLGVMERESANWMEEVRRGY